MTVIYKISLYLSSTGWRKIVQPFRVKETEKLFVSKSLDPVETFHLKKIKLLEIDSILRDSHKQISLFTFCRADQIKEAKELLEAELDRRVKLIRAEFNGLMNQYVGRAVPYIYPVIKEYPMPEPGNLKL